MRAIYEIAYEIAEDWQSVHYTARPYLMAMFELSHTGEDYGLDSAKSIIAYFLSNAQSWRGETARRIKTELKAMLK